MMNSRCNIARLLAASLLVALSATGLASAADESIYQEQPPVATASSEWLPACSPPIVIAAVYKHDHRIHIVGYVKNAMIGRKLKLQSKLGGGSTVKEFKTKSNGYFHINPRRPHHRHAPRAAWRVAGAGYRTPYVKLQRPLLLNNVHQKRGLLMINGEIKLGARSDTMITVQRLDDCHNAQLLGQIAMPAAPSTVFDGSVQLRDLKKPVATFVRLRVRVRERQTGAWGKSYWSLALPIVLRP